MYFIYFIDVKVYGDFKAHEIIFYYLRFYSYYQIIKLNIDNFIVIKFLNDEPLKISIGGGKLSFNHDEIVYKYTEYKKKLFKNIANNNNN